MLDIMKSVNTYRIVIHFCWWIVVELELEKRVKALKRYM